MSQTEKEVLGGGAGLAGAIAIESGTELGEIEVKARGYWEQVWRASSATRSRSPAASRSSCCSSSPSSARRSRSSSSATARTTRSSSAASTRAASRSGRLAHIADPLHPGHKTWLFLGADSTLGRDEFLRLLYGAQVSFEVALLATIGSISIGVLLGSMAGYFRGWVDTVVSRVTEITMAFPALLFIIALASTVGDSLNNITFGGIFGQGVFTLVPDLLDLRLVLPGAHHPRGRAQPAREGVRRGRPHGRLERLADHPLAHPAAPHRADHRLLDALGREFILGEAGLSYLGVGIKLPTASWGNLLQQASDYYTTQPWLMVWPGLAVLITTLCVQPARRRPARRVRPARDALAHRRAPSRRSWTPSRAGRPSCRE